jgi:hypothetical protein
VRVVTGPAGARADVARPKAGQARPLFFLHIPKTAGISVARMISPRFAAGRTHDTDPRTFVGDPDDFDFVAAHLDFSFVARFRARPVVLTFLRDPVERALSRWRYVHDVAPPQFPPPTRRQALANEFNRLARTLPLLDLLERQAGVARPLLANVQTAFLMGDGDAAPGAAPPVTRYERMEMPTRRSELEEAKRNLARCDVIGLAEEFDGSMERLARHLGWPGFGPSLALNVTRLKRADAPVPPRAREILADWNALDRELYAHARRLIAERRDRSEPGACGLLPRAEAYGFDQPIHGTGWHERERDAGGWFCWTGAAEESVLHLAVPGGVRGGRLRIRLAHVIHRDAMLGLRLGVNGAALPFTARPDGAEQVLEARVPAPVLAAAPGHLRLALRPGLRLRPSELAQTGDTRLLGLAVREIDFAPG